jgi:hypothetical protein
VKVALWAAELIAQEQQSSIVYISGVRPVNPEWDIGDLERKNSYDYS